MIILSSDVIVIPQTKGRGKGTRIPDRHARAVSIPVIASGGLAGIEDIEKLVSPQYAIIAGAIAGHALYEGRLDAKAALALMAAAA